MSMMMFPVCFSLRVDLSQKETENILGWVFQGEKQMHFDKKQIDHANEKALTNRKKKER
jgi:hypothetical protein